MQRYLKPDLLILDDMGMKQLPKRSGEYLFEIIMRRHELRSTIMTSNRPLEDWGKLIGDVPAATAILDRFLGWVIDREIEPYREQEEAFLELMRRQDRYETRLLLRPSKKNKKMFAPHAGEPALEIVWGDPTDAADVAQRMTGVTVTDGKYVFVRGLGERYSQTTLNGSQLPSPEPDDGMSANVVISIPRSTPVIRMASRTRSCSMSSTDATHSLRE